jgi:hypothetical protein
MASSTVNTEGINRLIGRLRALDEIDFEPLMLEWRKILEEDNEEGARLGLDGYGVPLDAVTYRPDPKAGTRKPINYDIQNNNNLTSSHYRTLDGPPLAPRGMQSRIVTNFRTAHQRDGKDWHALGAWEDVLSVQGIPFLGFHFRGEGNLPVRDLAHVRPGALARARQALVDFVRSILGRQP